MTYADTGGKAVHEIVAPLVEGKGVCEGIAKTGKMMLDHVNVPSVLAIGKADSVTEQGKRSWHAWLVVNIRKCWAHYDMTLDMCLSQNGIICYDYYALNDREIVHDHYFAGNLILPKCDRSQNYYLSNGLIAGNEKEFRNILQKRLKSGQKAIAVQFPSNVIRNNVQDFLQMAFSEPFGFWYEEKMNYQYTWNEHQHVLHILFK